MSARLEAKLSKRRDVVQIQLELFFADTLDQFAEECEQPSSRFPCSRRRQEQDSGALGFGRRPCHEHGVFDGTGAGARHQLGAGDAMIEQVRELIQTLATLSEFASLVVPRIARPSAPSFRRARQ